MVSHQEEEIISNNNTTNNNMNTKGKRTKRPRPLSPLALGPSDEPGPRGGEEGPASYGSDTSSADWAGPATDEEEDMAHCLILLAQGSKSSPVAKPSNDNDNDNDNNNSSNNNSVVVVSKFRNTYECKTCSRSFPSFQALGGHMASHKKPRLNAPFPLDGERKSPSRGGIFSLLSEADVALSLHLANNNNNNNNNNNSNSNNDGGGGIYSAATGMVVVVGANKASNKVHECGICGAEFSSGQALGGHMRRHRPIGGAALVTPLATSCPTSSIVAINSNNNNNNNNNNNSKEDKARNFLSLDLNLPAPEDEHHHQHHHRDPNFVFSSNEKTLVFSTTSLVDCHY